MRLIDADALIENLKNMCCADNSIQRRKIVDSTLHELMPQVIDDEPTIEAEPVKHGRWDTHDVVKILASGRILDGFCQCEACGSIFPFDFSEYSFCPECGARMDGVDE